MHSTSSLKGERDRGRNKEDREGKGKIGIRRKGNRRGRRDSNKEDTEGKGS